MTYYALFNSHNELVNIGECLLIEDKYGSKDVANTEVPEELYLDYKDHPDKYIAGEKEIEVINPETGETETITIAYPVIDEQYEEKQAAKRETEFNKEFFNTSLGYIRRKVTMADGTHKDFLSDLLPVISMAVTMKQAVSVLAYTAPDFSHDVEDWTQYQHQETVTAQFIQDCFAQLQNDFLPSKE